jgi:hypothetical protein
VIRPPARRGVRTVEVVSPACPVCGGRLAKSNGTSRGIEGERIRHRKCVECGLSVHVHVFGDCSASWKSGDGDDAMLLVTVEQTAAELGRPVSQVRDAIRRLRVEPSRKMETLLYPAEALRGIRWYLEEDDDGKNDNQTDPER